MVRISVVVPVFNTAMYLETCIAALKAQDYPDNDYEIIVVDNNSTDTSPEILAGSSGIVVLREEKQSSYAARNHGAREARGEILAFTDSDCFPEAGWLRAMEASLADPHVQVVLGSRNPLIKGGLVGMVSSYEEKKDQLTFNSSTPDVYYGYTNNMMVRRSIFDRYGPFVERSRGADTIFVRRVVNG
ncbi:MAG: glycosyltransferase family A protein, partial [Cyanobacteriota bacterium]|nr:glycosyltransferase family A protein [Cyanobacteriota bacterium]